MPLTIGLPRERRENERRVALVPAAVKRLLDSWPSLQIRMETGAGHAAGCHDKDYTGVSLVDDFAATVTGADIVVKVGVPTRAEIEQLTAGTVLVSLTRAFQNLDEIAALADARITTIGMDLVPRTARARALDATSSQATVAGYKAALLAAQLSPRLFPMMTTAAGTIRPSRVVVIGAGVAGLQAIATARRLGAEVEAYDIRSRSQERIESLGARMIDTGVEATDSSGHARPLRRDEQQHQHDVLADHLSRAHAVICAASIPDRPAPCIVTTDMVDGMLPDTVIVDMAAATGGNCELTRPGEHVRHGDTLIAGPLNLPSHGAVHASEMYAHNLTNMLTLLMDPDGNLVLDENDDIIARCVLTHAGDICQPIAAALMKRPCRAFGSAPEPVTDDEAEIVSDWIDESVDDASRDSVKGKDAPAAKSTSATSASSASDSASTSPPTSTSASVSVSAEENSEAQHGARPGGSPPAERSAKVAAVDPMSDASSPTPAPGGITTDESSVDTPSFVDAAAERVGDAAASTVDRTSGSTDASSPDLPVGPRDDLTVIDGIGPALQGRLYAFGVDRLVMLAELDAPARERLAVQLELDDEIEREDWTGQARRLLTLPPAEESD